MAVEKPRVQRTGYEVYREPRRQTLENPNKLPNRTIFASEAAIWRRNSLKFRLNIRARIQNEAIEEKKAL